jgi:phospholipid/cholesterol/gamma-HCH transport system substrate-binding protein
MVAVLGATLLSGCEWHNLNSLPMPGTQGSGPGAYEVKAALADVSNIQQNSRVRVGDVNVGTVAKIERQGWHALVTMTIDGDVKLPANAIAKVGQTSLMGSLHVELLSPTDGPPQGKLEDGSLIPLQPRTAYPTTEQTLAAVSMLLNGGGIGRIQEITKAFSTAFAGRAEEVKTLIQQMDQFIGHLDEQKTDIIEATDSLNNLVGQFADQKPVFDNALQTIPDALAVLKDEREDLAEALDQLGKFSALTADATSQTKAALIKELKDVAPVFDSFANAGPAMTRSFSQLAVYPWAKETLPKWIRGDYANLSAVIDLTLSRIDSSFFTGTRWEGDLTELEMQWGRTIGQMPSPATAGNPLVVPYHWDQGP